jgi:hypothetical protein
MLPAPQEPKATFRRHLTEKEKKKHAESGACMYCGKMGHFAKECPKKKFIQNSFFSNQSPPPKSSLKDPPKPSTETISSKAWNYNLIQQFSILIDLTVNRDKMIPTFALLDCSCSENFMQETFAKNHGSNPSFTLSCYYDWFQRPQMLCYPIYSDILPLNRESSGRPPLSYSPNPIKQPCFRHPLAQSS